MKWQHRDDCLGMQHDCEPLPNGNITLFANGYNTTTNPFSRVIELDPKTNKTVWEYRGRPSYTFFSPHISGAQRLGSRQYADLRRAMGPVCSKSRRPARSSGNMSVPSWAPTVAAIPANEVFRTYRYAVDSPQIQNRVGTI